MKTFLKRLLLTLGVLAAGLILFHLIENWRGARALEQWRSASVAAGIPQNLDQLVPPRIPDAENFAAHPLLAATVAGTNPAGPVAPGVFWEHGASRVWLDGRAMDLEGPKATLKVADLRPVLAPFDAPLKALVEASLRPHSRLLATYRLENDDIPIPLLLGMRQYARVLGLRAVLELRGGHSEAALTDTLTILQVAEHLKQEPHLISHLLRIAYVNLAIQPMWEGLRDHRWNDQQLAQLQQTLGGLDLLESWPRPWEAEGLFLRRAMLGMASAPRWPRPRMFGDGGSGKGRVADYLSVFFVPKGWVYQNLIRLERENQAQYLKPVDAVGHRVDARAIDQARAAWANAPRRPYTFLAKLFTMDLASQSLRMSHAQASLDQAFIACALERYRLVHRAYPESLGDLSPAFATRLPLDLISGKSLHYRAAGKGAYVLYSVGWNGTDEGGKVAHDVKQAAPLLDQGDWVWSAGMSS